MAEALRITANASKQDIYEEILPQISALIEGEDNLVANLANIAAVLNTAFGHLWTGFYVRSGTRLVLGPFQGPIACTSIPLKPTARGVCGYAASRRETVIVPDVEKFPGHIACSSASRSEIVVPLVSGGETELVLDVDSRELNAFDAVDAQYLELVIALVKARHFKAGAAHARKR
jgi:L-methionine (R)-S-oxide reductase